MMTRTTAMFVGVALLAAVGCSSGPEPVTATPVQTGLAGGGVTGAAKEPVWVSLGAAAFPGDRGKFLYAVGASAKRINQPLTETLARDRARQEMGRIIETDVASMIRDFMEAHKDYADPKGASSIEFTQVVSKSVSSASVPGAIQRDAWTAPDGTLYVLMGLAVEDLVRETEKAAREAAQKKAVFIREKAEKAFADLDAEIEKRMKQGK